jgi:hypothetical protein
VLVVLLPLAVSFAADDLNLDANRAAPEESRDGPINYQMRARVTWFLMRR